MRKKAIFKQKIVQKMKGAQQNCAAVIFEEGCALFRQNGYYCLEAYLIWAMIATIWGLGLIGAWKMQLSFWLICGWVLVGLLMMTMVEVGKNKNLGAMVREMTAGRYPLWLSGYWLAGLRVMAAKAILNASLWLTAILALFYVFVSPSVTWFWISVISGGAFSIWLKMRFGLAPLILSVKQKFTLKEGLKLSWQRTKDKTGLMMAIIVLNIIVLSPTVIILPVIGWFFASVIITFEGLILNQRFYESSKLKKEDDVSDRPIEEKARKKVIGPRGKMKKQATQNKKRKQ